MNINTNERVVVSAANKHYYFGVDIIILGVRHFDSIMRSQIQTIETIIGKVKWEQGFIDNKGVFMDRKIALLVATEAGQINYRRTKNYPLNELFSEDLY